MIPRIIKFLLRIILIIHIFCFLAYSEDLKSECSTLGESVLRTHNDEDARHAFEVCLPFAKKGDAEAQYHIGGLYSSNLGGIKREELKTFKWMKLSAEQGFPRSQWYLASMYESGNSIQKNLELALYWYHEAAKQDEIPALLDLGRIYHKGIGIPVDGAEAVRLYERAAEKNISNAIKALIEIYSKGLPGFPPNNERAKYWQQKLHDGNSVN